MALVNTNVVSGTHPFTHLAVVDWQADEMKGRLLDEVRVQDSHLRGFFGHGTGHGLPEAVYTSLKSERQKVVVTPGRVFIRGRGTTQHPSTPHGTTGGILSRKLQDGNLSINMRRTVEHIDDRGGRDRRYGFH